MGAAVCYKAKPQTITKEDVLKALNDQFTKQSISESIAENTESTKTSVKTEELQNQRQRNVKIEVGGRMTPHLVILDTVGGEGITNNNSMHTKTLNSFRTT